MKFFSSSSKQRYNKELANSVWICEATDDVNATYYKLRFVAHDFVEGWVKYIDQEEESKVFLASFEKEKNLFGIDKLNITRSKIPAVTHVDFSARIQTVEKSKNQLYYKLIARFDELTKVPILVNTSFNIRGEPIVCSVEDAYRCFLTTDLDILICGNYILNKQDQYK